MKIICGELVQRDWPLIVRTGDSHVLHISEYNSVQYTCGSITKCGRDLRYTCTIGDRIKAEDFDDDDAKSGWKKTFHYVHRLKKSPVMCPR